MERRLQAISVDISKSFSRKHDTTYKPKDGTRNKFLRNNCCSLTWIDTLPIWVANAEDLSAIASLTYLRFLWAKVSSVIHRMFHRTAANGYQWTTVRIDFEWMTWWASFSGAKHYFLDHGMIGVAITLSFNFLGLLHSWKMCPCFSQLQHLDEAQLNFFVVLDQCHSALRQPMCRSSLQILGIFRTILE